MKTSEKQLAAVRLWRTNNPDYHAIYQKQYLINNPWMNHYYSAKSRLHKSHNFLKPTYQHRKFYLTNDLLKQLWFRDKAYEMNHPHLHRVNNNGHYTFENCAFIEGKIHNSLHSRKLI